MEENKAENGTPSVLAGYYSDPRYQQAANCLKQAKYEEAIEFFGELLQACEAKYGDVALECAPAYYEYGNAIFARVEETTDLLGDAVKEAQERAKANAKEGEDGDENPEDEVDDIEGGDEEDPAPQVPTETVSGEEAPPAEETEEDKQLAWEVLEVARKIYLDHQGTDTDFALSNVYSRLADISRFDGHHREAIRDYSECLRLRQASLPPTSRDLADVLYNMGVCHVYHSNEEGVQRNLELQQAVEKYSQAREVLSKRMNLEETGAAEKADLQSIIEDLTEELETLQEDLRTEGTATSSSAQLPTTTIGFGAPTSTTTPVLIPTVPVTRTEAAPNTSAEAASTTGVTTLQGRSKKKRADLAQVSTTTDHSEDQDAKRVRAD